MISSTVLFFIHIFCALILNALAPFSFTHWTRASNKDFCQLLDLTYLELLPHKFQKQEFWLSWLQNWRLKKVKKLVNSVSHKNVNGFWQYLVKLQHIILNIRWNLTYSNEMFSKTIDIHCQCGFPTTDFRPESSLFLSSSTLNWIISHSLWKICGMRYVINKTALYKQ